MSRDKRLTKLGIQWQDCDLDAAWRTENEYIIPFKEDAVKRTHIDGVRFSDIPDIIDRTRLISADLIDNPGRLELLKSMEVKLSYIALAKDAELYLQTLQSDEKIREANILWDDYDFDAARRTVEHGIVIPFKEDTIKRTWMHGVNIVLLEDDDVPYVQLIDGEEMLKLLLSNVIKHPIVEQSSEKPISFKDSHAIEAEYKVVNGPKALPSSEPGEAQANGSAGTTANMAGDNFSDYYKGLMKMSNAELVEEARSVLRKADLLTDAARTAPHTSRR